MKAIRRNMRRIAVLLVLVLLLPIAYEAWTLSRNGGRYFASRQNVFARQKKSNVTAGNIYDRGGILLAQTVEGKREYAADPAVRKAMVHVLSDISGKVSNGVESFMAYHLYGFNATLGERLSAWLQGSMLQGDSVVLTVDSALSAYVAAQFPTGKCGAVTVVNTRTGEVLAECSFPSYDPALDTTAARTDRGKPFFNRAVQGLYTPGSTFKIVTAACALQNWPDALQRSFECTGRLMVGERLITDAGTDLENGKITVHGTMNLQKAFQVSCNNTFAGIALQLGDETLRKTAEEMLFNYNFLFKDLVVENSSYPSDDRNAGEIAWTGAGQSALQISPMHMCMITCAVANGGVMQEPWLLQRSLTPSGAVRQSWEGQGGTRLMNAETAAVLCDMMRSVVTGGTGTRAAVDGHRICGKTGSAELDGQEETNAWFTGFIDEEDAPYAVTVVVENAGGGGSVAAPVAQKIFRWLLEHKP